MSCNTCCFKTMYDCHLQQDWDSPSCAQWTAKQGDTPNVPPIVWPIAKMKVQEQQNDAVQP